MHLGKEVLLSRQADSVILHLQIAFCPALGCFTAVRDGCKERKNGLKQRSAVICKGNDAMESS